MTQVTAIDLGASSGRALLGRFDGRTIKTEELHRFSNDPVEVRGTLHWDILRLYREILESLAQTKGQGEIAAIGIDTWGVDFGLLAADGSLLQNPVHYRDRRTAGQMEKVFRQMPAGPLYRRTGIQFMDFNTIFQLTALQEQQPWLLEQAETLLFTPDLLAYFLTGTKQAEYTMASTSQLLNPYSGNWDTELIRLLRLPERLFPRLADPGNRTGLLSPEIAESLGIPQLPVMTVASHDTQSAIAAVPAREDDFLYISSGTWSLLGTVSAKPWINDLTYRKIFTNEGFLGRQTCLLRNIMGLWLIQESRRQWQREGHSLSYGDLERMALEARSFRSLFDPDDVRLMPPGDIPGRVRELCREKGEAVPETIGEVVRAIYESLALKYKLTADEVEEVTGRRYPKLYVVGGGTKDGLLSQFTANSTGREVLAGPVEATALGNMAVSLIALGELRDLGEARQVIAASFPQQRYQPEDRENWEEAAARFRNLLA